MDKRVNARREIKIVKRTPPSTKGFVERLHQAANYRGIFDAPALLRLIHRQTGVKLSPAVGHKWWKGETKNISAFHVALISISLGARGWWLLLGRGERERPPGIDIGAQATANLVRAYEEATPSERVLVDGWVKHILSKPRLKGEG